jgi:diacylglycerol kinase family enzyme
MYQYIYDAFLLGNKYSKILTLIENRLADLGLNGRRERLNLFKDPKELIVEGIKRGVKTVVVIGNDITLNRVINAAGELDVTLGFIPVGPNNKIAKVLGIEEGAPACDCLSNRLVQKIDLGKINEHYFLSHVQTSSVNLKCGSKYCITSVKTNQIEILNLPTFDATADPQDGYLEARLKPLNRNFFTKSKNKERESFFPVKKIFLESRKETPILVDGLKVVNTPAKIQILPKKLKIIVGKRRFF